MGPCYKGEPVGLFAVSTRMAFGGGTLPDQYKWSNKWFIEADTVSDAADAGMALWVDNVRDAHNEACYCYEIYATDADPESSLYEVRAVEAGNQRGTLFGTTGTEYYNPAICVRMNLNVAGSRPSRKFLRIGLQEAWMGDGGRAISASGVTSALNTLAGLLASFTSLRDESGNVFSSVAYDGVTVRKLGKLARFELPTPPAFG